jgi:hypothetical protein
MTKQEFENHAGGPVDDDDYGEANIVYMYHPLCNTKEDIGQLWRLGGIVLIRDMMRRALKCRSIHEQITKANEELERRRLELEKQFRGEV